MTKSGGNEINYLSISDMESIVTSLQSIREEFTEDIPSFDTRFEGVLESILEQIKSQMYGRELYHGVVSKATWMFYCLIKNHPFLNGNKRIAVVALFDFLKRNINEL